MKNTFFTAFFFLITTLFIHAGAIRVMPLGDSITYDDSYADKNNPRPASLRHAYRNYLWYKLRDARYWVNFVGSRVVGTAIIPHFDPENEGYPGETTDFIGNHVYGFLVRNPADIILLHIGTNDRWSLGSNGSYMGGMRKIFNEINRFEQNYHHHVKIILALIIGRRDNDYSSFTNTFNAHLHSLANSRIAQGDDIYIIDMQHNAGLNYHSDFQDPAHPNNTGYSKMANLWYNALRRFLPPPGPVETVPNKPSTFTTATITATSVTLRWSDSANNEQGYKIYKGSQLIATLGANTTQLTLSGLTPKQQYTYRIVAFNNAGTSSSKYITFTTKDDYGWLPAIYHIILY